MTDYLWTPWRMNYISGAHSPAGSPTDGEPPTSEDASPQDEQPPMESTGCVFCDRIRLPQSRDRDSLILLRSEHTFVILNLYPYNSAHLMVVPRLHTSDFSGLPPETLIEMSALAQRMVRVIGDEYHPQGFNLGMNLGQAAGAGVADHLHLHVVPRWIGDTNFMPIVGATKVMPELLETTYDRLRARLSKE
jgi:ATP adenylyltransferase